MRITVRERSTAEISESAYRILESTPDFWALVEEGIFSLLRSKGKKFGLKANAYVGQFSIGERFHLQVTEKVPGSVAGLIRCAAPDDLRTLLSPSLHGNADTLLTEYARQLIRAVGRYVSHGRVKSYVCRTDELSSPKGRIDMRASALRLARGKKGRLVCTRQVLSADLPVNQILGLSLAAAEPLLRAQPELAEVRALCLTYAPMFDDVSWRRLAHQPARVRAGLFDAAFAHVRHGTDLYVALGYARALILNLGSWSGDEKGLLTPHSYFLNLETLFENAVRQVLQELIGKNMVQKGIERKVPLFAEVSERYIVDPDIVVSGGDLIVADCKYKDLSGYPAHADVYQLAAHAQALGAKRSVLILPGEERALVKLGTTISGLEMNVAQVRPRELYDDLKALASVFALGAPANAVSACC